MIARFAGPEVLTAYLLTALPLLAHSSPRSLLVSLNESVQEREEEEQ